MENKKNFIAFLFLSMAVLLIWQQLFPAPAPPKPNDGGQPEAADKDAKAGGDAKLVAGPDVPTEGAAAAENKEVAADAGDAPMDEEPLQFVSLGSLDRDAGYRMLVTLTNQGAAVKRAELTSSRFLDLVDRSGYLGHLEFDDTSEGPKVRIVGAGTPADKAGLKIGDVITGIERTAGKMVDVKTAEDFHDIRARTESGDEIALRVVRDGGTPQTLSAKLVRRPLEVIRPEIENVRMRDGKIPPGFIDPPSFLASISTADLTLQGVPLKGAKAKRVHEWLEQGNWKIAASDASSATFERELPQENLKLTKRYRLEPVPAASRDNGNYPAYNLTLEIEVANTGEAEQLVAYRLDGPNGLPMEGWWYAHKISRDHWFSAAGLRDVIVRYQGQSVTQFDGPTIAKDGKMAMDGGASLAFVGVDAVYFSSVIIPVKKSLDEDWFDFTEALRVGPELGSDTPARFVNVSCRLTRKPLTLAAGASHTDAYTLFMGPKRPELLTQYKAANDPNYSLRDIIFYGMWPFGAVARGMLAVLHFFHSIVGNFGIAIIMLTVLVRGAMFPISFKQTQNMARMQALKPELDRITEKYKTDMQKRSAAMQELYRKNKINPLGGCLPVLLQLPIFIGLYRSIMIDVELRQTPLFSEAIRWCSDLSAPDMLYDWSWLMPRSFNSGEGILALGPYFNLLPIVTVVLFLVSMKMSMPEPTNEQALMQQKMMKYMTGFMGLLFYKVASGLCLYFIASSLWGLGERRLLKKAKNDDGSQAVKTPLPPPRPSSNGSNGSPDKRGSKEKRKR